MNEFTVKITESSLGDYLNSDEYVSEKLQSLEYMDAVLREKTNVFIHNKEFSFPSETKYKEILQSINSYKESLSQQMVNNSPVITKQISSAKKEIKNNLKTYSFSISEPDNFYYKKAIIAKENSPEKYNAPIFLSFNKTLLERLSDKLTDFDLSNLFNKRVTYHISNKILELEFKKYNYITPQYSSSMSIIEYLTDNNDFYKRLLDSYKSFFAISSYDKRVSTINVITSLLISHKNFENVVEILKSKNLTEQYEYSLKEIEKTIPMLKVYENEEFKKMNSFEKKVAKELLFVNNENDINITNKYNDGAFSGINTILTFIFYGIRRASEIKKGKFVKSINAIYSLPRVKQEEMMKDVIFSFMVDSLKENTNNWDEEEIKKKISRTKEVFYNRYPNVAKYNYLQFPALGFLLYKNDNNIDMPDDFVLNIVEV